MARKQMHRSARSIWSILALLLVCGLLVLTLYLVQRKPNNVPLPLAGMDEHQPLRTDPKDIASITVTPVADPAFTLVRDGDTFVLEGSPDYPLKPVDLENLIDHIALIEPAEVVGALSQLAEGAASFGLTDQSPHVAVRLVDGRTMGFRFGADAPTETPTVYFMLDNDPHVYTINRSIRDLFDRGLHFLHTVPDVAVADTSAIRSIEIEKDGRTTAVARSKHGDWRIATPNPYPVNDQAMGLLLDSIRNLRFAVFVEDITEHTDMETYGIAPTSPIVDITLENDQVMRLSLGQDIQGVGLYCAYEGAVYMASYMAVGPLQSLSVETLAFRGITEIDFPEMRKVEMQVQCLVYAYDILWYERIAANNALVYDEHGKVVMDVEVTSEGQVIDADVLIRFFERLSALRPVAAVSPDATYTMDAPWLTITIFGGSEQQMLAFHRMGDGKSMLSVDGVIVWAYDEAALQAAVNHLVGT